jgi:hypothetical protein
VSINTQISRHPSQWRLRDQQTVLSKTQGTSPNGRRGRRRARHWSFSHGGPLVVRGCGDWGVISRAPLGPHLLGGAGMMITLAGETRAGR